MSLNLGHFKYSKLFGSDRIYVGNYRVLGDTKPELHLQFIQNENKEAVDEMRWDNKSLNVMEWDLRTACTALRILANAKQ